MEINYSRDSLKFLAKLDKKTADRILKGIKGLTYSPPQGDIKVMKGFGRKKAIAYRCVSCCFSF